MTEAEEGLKGTAGELSRSLPLIHDTMAKPDCALRLQAKGVAKGQSPPGAISVQLVDLSPEAPRSSKAGARVLYDVRCSPRRMVAASLPAGLRRRHGLLDPPLRSKSQSWNQSSSTVCLSSEAEQEAVTSPLPINLYPFLVKQSRLCRPLGAATPLEKKRIGEAPETRKREKRSISLVYRTFQQ